MQLERARVGSHLQTTECLPRAQHCEIQRLEKIRSLISKSFQSRGKARRRGCCLGSARRRSDEGAVFTGIRHSSAVQVPALEEDPICWSSAMRWFAFSFPSSLIRLLCLSKTHTIHVISIQIQNLSDYCSECSVIPGFFFWKSTYLTRIFNLMCNMQMSSL